MTALSPYKMSGSYDYVLDGNMPPQQVSESAPQTFVSLLEFVSEIYEVNTLSRLFFHLKFHMNRFIHHLY